MLSVFPTMFLSLLAHALLRVIAGSILISLGYRHLFRERAGIAATLSEHWPRSATLGVWVLGALEIVCGMMFFVGAATQVAALVMLALSIAMLVFRKRLAHPAIPSPMFWTLFLGVSLSLLITGAGALAVDLPL